MQITETHAFRAFQYRNFRRLFPASLFSNLGSWGQFVAQDWLVLELTESAFLLSIVAMLQLLPSLFLSVPAGAFADRYHKRGILIATNLISLISAISVGVLVITENVAFWHVMLFATLLGIANAIDGPVRQAFNTELVGPNNVSNAVALISANVNVARLLGPAAAGFLIHVYGIGTAFLINAVSFAYMAMVLLTMHKAELFQPVAIASKTPVRDGIAYLRNRPDLQATLLMVFVAAGFGLNFNLLNAIMAKNVFELDATGFGLLGSAAGVGSLTAALISTKLEHLRTPKFVWQAAAGFGSVLALAAWMPTAISYALVMPVVGFGVLLTMIAGNGVMQANTEVGFRGRVLGWFMLAFNAPLGQPILGWLATTVSDRFAISAAGFLTLILVNVIWFSYQKRINAMQLYR